MNGEINRLIETLSTNPALSQEFESNPTEVIGQLGIKLSDRSTRVVENMKFHKRKPRYVKNLFSGALNTLNSERDRILSTYLGILMSQYCDCLLEAEKCRRSLKLSNGIVTSPMFTLLPVLIANEGVSRQDQTRITVIYSLMCDACIGMDRLIDGDTTIDSKKVLDLFTGLAHFQELMTEFDKDLHSKWSRRFTEFIRAAHEELKEEGKKNISLSATDHERLSRMKHEIFFFAIDLTCNLVPYDVAEAEKCLTYYFNGVQLFDDLIDADVDLRAGRQSYVLTELASANGDLSGKKEKLRLQTINYYKQAVLSCPQSLSALHGHFSFLSDLIQH